MTRDDDTRHKSPTQQPPGWQLFQRLHGTGWKLSMQSRRPLEGRPGWTLSMQPPPYWPDDLPSPIQILFTTLERAKEGDVEPLNDLLKDLGVGVIVKKKRARGQPKKNPGKKSGGLRWG